jgi:hypothetical protein
MTLAEFVNKIVVSFPKVVFEYINYDDLEVTGIVVIAHHKYHIFGRDNEFAVHEELNTCIERNAFSRRIEGILNGWKRNEAGEMVKPVGVASDES